MEIKIKDHTNTDTLRHRETAKKLLQIINQQPEKQVTLNFKGITFTSRAFTHELITGLKKP
jgi:type II secretory pathway component PulC